MKRVTMMLMAFALMPIMALAATWYVDGTNGSDSYSGTSLSAAMKTIQAAIDAANKGDTILVAPGMYAPIDASNVRVTIKSISGPHVTVIDAQRNGRCATLGIGSWDRCDYSTLDGFTVTRGLYSSDAGSAIYAGFAENCIVSNCEGRAIVHASGIRNCLVVQNTVTSYGAVMHSEACNCTVVSGSRCASWDCGFYNSIVKGGTYTSHGQDECYYHCCLDSVVRADRGNFVADPKFVDSANGDYHLVADSPCIDAGDNSYVGGTKDLGGVARVVNGTVDIGCYEYHPPVLYVNGTTGDDSNAGYSPRAAKKTIQAAIDAATDGGMILVAPGTYEGITAINRCIRIQSIAGAEQTIIDGGLRACADFGYNTTNGVLVGFTCQNSVLWGVAGGRAYNCILKNNGRGSHHGYIENCLVVNNSAGENGGGCQGSICVNCTIVGNRIIGGGVGSGTYSCSLNNCIVYDNEIFDFVEDDDWWCKGEYSYVARHCVVSSDPHFVDATNGDYRLAADSPCIDAGDNSYVGGDTDLEGGRRIINDKVDIGCYEFEPDGGPYVEKVGDVDWTYMIKGGRASLGDGVSAAAPNLAGSVSVPVRLQQRPVVAIDAKAFADCSDVTSVKIPQSVMDIGDSAFKGCNGLRDVYLKGNTLSAIDSEAFVGCHWDLIVHVPADWQGRGRTLCGYTVWRVGSSDEEKFVCMAVTNVIAQYVLNSIQPGIAVPVSGDTGFVTVITEVKSSGAVAVPSEWKDNYPTFADKYGTDFGKALMMKSGKKDGAGNDMFVWQDYVAGTDPTNPDDKFTASVTIVEGVPVISWTPELPAEQAALRKYTTYGKAKLQDAEWSVVNGDEANYNFFKVTVEMK